MLIDAVATAIDKVETRHLFHAKQYLDAAFNGGQKHIGVETRHGENAGFGALKTGSFYCARDSAARAGDSMIVPSRVIQTRCRPSGSTFDGISFREI